MGTEGEAAMSEIGKLDDKDLVYRVENLAAEINEASRVLEEKRLCMKDHRNELLYRLSEKKEASGDE